MAHSLGGYISCCYTIKYQQYVKKLLLVGAPGFAYKPDDFDWNKYVTKVGGYFRQKIALCACKMWDKNISVFELLRKSGAYMTGKLIDEYYVHRFPNMPPEDRTLLKHYFMQIFLLPGSGEYTANAILKVGGFAAMPLTHRMHDVQVPISFFYGDRDWMPHNDVQEFKEA